MDAESSERLLNGGGDCVFRAQSERASKERKKGQFHASASLSLGRAVVNGWNFDREDCGLAYAARPGSVAFTRAWQFAADAAKLAARIKRPVNSSNERIRAAKTFLGAADLIATLKRNKVTP